MSQNPEGATKISASFHVIPDPDLGDAHVLSGDEYLLAKKVMGSSSEPTSPEGSGGVLVFPVSSEGGRRSTAEIKRAIRTAVSRVLRDRRNLGTTQWVIGGAISGEYRDPESGCLFNSNSTTAGVSGVDFEDLTAITRELGAEMRQGALLLVGSEDSKVGIVRV